MLTAAQRAHEAIVALKAEEAKQILFTALRADPTNPELMCEQAILDCFTQRELQAVGFVEKVASAANGEQLRTILRNHFFCCSLMDPNDVRARKNFELVSHLDEERPTGVGIEVSAILIVKNEQERLPQCLSSLKGVVSQIVVIDTGSTDRTVEIAESFGATIGFFEWCDDYAAARNESLKLATGHWALWIDADEELDPRAIPALHRAIVRPQFGGYYTEIVNYTDDRADSNEFVHNAIRLFRNVPGVKFTEAIHEQVKPSLADLGFVWATIDGPFFKHHGYRPSEMESKGKIDKTIALLERVVASDPTSAFQWFNLANAYLIGARYDDAISAARQCAKMLDEGRDYGSLTYQVWANASARIGDVDGCLQACIEADKAGYGGILNEFERASILAHAGRFDEALVAADKCMNAPWPKGKPGDRGIFTHKRYLIRGQILSDIGRFEEAQEMFDRALTGDPGCAPAMYSKGFTYERIGDFESARNWFSRSQGFSDTRQVSEEGLARCAAVPLSAEEARESLRDSWQAEPNNIDKFVLWLKSCEASGDIQLSLFAFQSLSAVITLTADLWIDWGRIHEAAGNLDQALECFSSAMREDASNFNAYFNAGDLLYRRSSYLDAAHLYESGLRYAPEHSEAWFTLGNCLAQLGLNDGAVTCYRQTLTFAPGHGGATHNLAVVLQDSVKLAA